MGVSFGKNRTQGNTRVFAIKDDFEVEIICKCLVLIKTPVENTKNVPNCLSVLWSSHLPVFCYLHIFICITQNAITIILKTNTKQVKKHSRIVFYKVWSRPVRLKRTTTSPVEPEQSQRNDQAICE